MSPSIGTQKSGFAGNSITDQCPTRQGFRKGIHKAHRFDLDASPFTRLEAAVEPLTVNGQPRGLHKGIEEETKSYFKREGMKMSNKLLLSCASLAAFMALALVPGLASAAQVTQGGALLANGSAGTASSSNLQFAGSNGTTIKCTENDLGGTLVDNGGVSGSPTITIETAYFKNGGVSPRCATTTANTEAEVTVEGLTQAPSNAGHWCLHVKSAVPTTWQLTGSACGAASAPISFILHLYVFGIKTVSCTFSRTEVHGTVNNGEPTVLTVGTGQVFKVAAGSSSSCPAEGTLTGSFTVTSGGKNVKVDN